nr:T cell receptor V alpha 11, TCR V alpha 11=major histocompatibility complex class II-dependent [mice, B6, transgenic, lymph node cells, Peptide Partial, 24 aa] [Mus sp.]
CAAEASNTNKVVFGTGRLQVLPNI